MNRLILSLGLVWALIYTANHTVFVRAPSDTKAKVATSTQQVSTDRRIDSWGAYLPHIRPRLPNDPLAYHLSLASRVRSLHAKCKLTQPLLQLQPMLLQLQKRRDQTLGTKRVANRETQPHWRADQC